MTMSMKTEGALDIGDGLVQTRAALRMGRLLCGQGFILYALNSICSREAIVTT